MRFHLTPRPLLHLLTAILLAPRPALANPRPVASVQNGFTYDELFARYACSGQLCGYNDQLCCNAGSACYTDYNNQAQCSATASGYVSGSAAPAQSSANGGGYWVYITTTTVITNYQTITTVYSSYVPGYASVSAAASVSGNARCNFALNQSPCGDICCKANQYCARRNQCSAAAPGQTTTTANGYHPSQSAGAPLRPTSSGVVVQTATVRPSTTLPFSPPVATGANITMTESAHHSGLSGGAIAGIVIGVLVGLLILGLICFYCCLKGLLDGCLALFGLGKSRRRTEVTEYERRTHHSGGGGRTWYGAAKPSRVDRREKRESHTGRDLLGVGAGLAGLWAILGLKRRNQRRKEDRYSEYSYSSDYYTSASE